MKTVLVTGANGQLGQCLKNYEKSHSDLNFIFKTSSELDITNKSNIEEICLNSSINYCINCAAYTAVELAENEPDKAKKINEIGVKYLSEICLKYNITLIHISTDFVFDGYSNKPYSERDITNPISVYGLTKRNGETIIENRLEKYFIINVVNDQVGSPTNCMDLSYTILMIISNEFTKYGIYHYSNKGFCNWFEFAQEIFKLKGISIKINPISSSQYPTLALRPKYSVLDTNKISKDMNIKLISWKKSLKIHFKNLENKTYN